MPVRVDDLSDLVKANPRGPVTIKLNWTKLNADDFEGLIFALISSEPGYENPEWLMRTSAPDRGRDLSVTRVIVDRLAGTLRVRVVIQCKHWLARSIALSDVSAAKEQMSLWDHARIEVLAIATSGRFTADAVNGSRNITQRGIQPGSRCGPRVMGENTYVSASQSVGGGTGRKVSVQYFLTRWLSVTTSSSSDGSREINLSLIKQY